MIYYYKTYQDDFIESKNQNFHIAQDYEWIHTNFGYRFLAQGLYFFALLFGAFYCRFFLHVHIKNKKVLKKYHHQGFFLYGNHTQPLGDVFIPALVSFPKRIYTFASEANMGVSGIGKLLPYLGILPVVDSIEGTKKLWNAVQKRIQQKKCVVIYPEAHVWPYYTKIRPFHTGSFRFPVDTKRPCFCMTTTYQKRKLSKKPRITVFVDGPFFSDSTYTAKENQKKLCEEISQAMEERSQYNNMEYHQYVLKEE